MFKFIGKLLCLLEFHCVNNWDWTFVEYEDNNDGYECEVGYCKRCGKRFEK